ncbi:MAG TPA: hypothetical protein VJ438_04660, partial [Candidatus Nanoarchaeia archaeon]|nr:hypothetical protein [Candidatus Nanoarchaeia archaeon]
MNKMQKKFLVLFFIIILSISSISAGWFSDFFSKITGKTSDVNAVVCTDSDGGRDYYKRGSVYGYCYDCTNPLVIGSNSDHCADANNLREFYCTDSQGWIREVVNCPNGCKDGACKKEPIQNITCTDSDGRENYYVKGKTSLGPNNYVDYCNKEGMVDECYDPNCYLNEYYCYSPTIMGQKSDIVCPYGCKNG